MNQTISLSEAGDERGGLPSASAWARYEACPASWQLEQSAKAGGQAAHQIQSAEARSGERIHAALAGLPVEPALSETETTSVEFLRERGGDQVRRLFGESAPIKELLEERFWLEIGGARVASGRADRVVYLGTTALVQDYKSGFREPQAAEVNAQLKVLAVLVALQLPFITEVVAQLVTGPFGILEARYDVYQLGEAYASVVETLKRINDSDPVPQPGREQCRYCPAINICPAIEAMQTPVAQQCQAVKLPEREDAAPLLNSIEILERQIKAVKEYYTEAMKADPTYQIPGWALVPGPQRREVKDWRGARARLAQVIDAGELDGLADYSIPAVEKLLAKSLAIKPKDAGQKLAQILDGYLSVKPGNLLLKPATRAKPLTLAD